MELDPILTVVAGAAYLGLAALAAVRAGRSGLAVPTALLRIDLSAYNGLELLGNLTAEAHWEWLESAAASLAAPLLFHLVLAFLGARRTQRSLLRAVYAAFSLLALSCLAPFVLPSTWAFPGGDGWASVMLVLGVPSGAYAATKLALHYRRSTSADERARTLLFLLTLAVGAGGPATDLAAIAGLPAVPRLAAGAMLLGAILLTALALRERLLRGPTALLVLSAVLVALVAVAAQVLVVTWAGTDLAAFALGTVLVTVLVLGAARVVFRELTELRERTAQLATLGRLSAQMAHDLRNPIAAIQGAAQYLEEERRRSGAPHESDEMLGLILDETRRLERVVAGYQRLGRAEPVLESVAVPALLSRVATASRLAHGVDVQVKMTVAHDARVDADLVTAALENLVRNAAEAMGGSGTVTLAAAIVDWRSGTALALSVADDGPGMDARTREQAGDAFFTTKAAGSGLGLAFVRRVAEAHGGELRIDSRPGAGTRVTLLMPMDP